VGEEEPSGRLVYRPIGGHRAPSQACSTNQLGNLEAGSSFLLMTDHPMFLEYDGASNAYRSHLCGAFTSVEHSFETLAAARHALHLVGLRIGAKTDERTWRIEFIEPVAERADAFRLRDWANGNREQIKRPDQSECRQNG
jgi:hypothetical protein